jgi:hypothetical protein
MSERRQALRNIGKGAEAARSGGAGQRFAGRGEIAIYTESQLSGKHLCEKFHKVVHTNSDQRRVADQEAGETWSRILHQGGCPAPWHLAGT